MMPFPAVVVLTVLALALAWWWRPRQPTNPAAWITICALTILGGTALWFAYDAPAPPSWAFLHWKPTALYWTLSAIFLAAPFLGWGYPAKWVFSPYLPLATRQWALFNRILALLYAVLGAINLLMAYNTGEGDWQGFKEACYMNLIAIFLVRINFVWLPLLKDIAVVVYRLIRRTP